MGASRGCLLPGDRGSGLRAQRASWAPAKGGGLQREAAARPRRVHAEPGFTPLSRSSSSFTAVLWAQRHRSGPASGATAPGRCGHSVFDEGGTSWGFAAPSVFPRLCFHGFIPSASLPSGLFPFPPRSLPTPSFLSSLPSKNKTVIKCLIFLRDPHATRWRCSTVFTSIRSRGFFPGEKTFAPKLFLYLFPHIPLPDFFLCPLTSKNIAHSLLALSILRPREA